MWPALGSNALLAWTERRRALRELENLQLKEEWALKFDDGNLINRAMAAIVADDQVTALQCWQEAVMRYPRFAKKSRDSLDILLGLRRFDEAEALMSEGCNREPQDSYYAGGYAMVAERRGDTEEAIQRWSRVRRKFPHYWRGYVHGSICLCQTGQLEAAEALNNKAITLFPDVQRAWAESARIAEHRRDWPEAIRRWEVFLARFRQAAGDVGIARGLEELGRIEEAEQRLKEAQVRRPLERDISIALARLANKRGDKEGAVMCWADARRRFPVLQFGYQGGFRQLLEMGRYEDAEAILRAAADRFPAEAWPTIENASLASTREDWATATTRWAAVRARWPDRQEGYTRGAEALAALGRQDEATQLRIEYRQRSAS